MERADKIFFILCMAALICALSWRHTRRHDTPRIFESATPSIAEGPSYLSSNLPIVRRSDDFADAVSTDGVI